LAGLDFTLQPEDFVEAMSLALSLGVAPTFTHAVLNPPYKKIRSVSPHRHALREAGIEATNLYSAFVALAILLLADGGELVAITPRSFCNGQYFKPFRALMLQHCALMQVHVFESRTNAFKSDDVLQENVIFHLVKGARQGRVIVSSSLDSAFTGMTQRAVPFSEVVMPSDADQVLHLVAEDEDATVEAGVKAYTHTLEDLGLGVSTGPVVDFRLREHLRETMEPGCVPLIYPLHFTDGFIEYPKTAKKPTAIVDNEETHHWLMPSGCYTVVRRLSSKEEKRRIVPAIFDPKRVVCKQVGFENHLNVFHAGKKGLPAKVAKGLAVYLGSSIADKWLRRFNGHTQVNAGDLKTLRYPSIETLEAWGSLVSKTLPTQEEIDRIVEGGLVVKN
jgi:adenine-specific DNA-methyltransferase